MKISKKTLIIGLILIELIPLIILGELAYKNGYENLHESAKSDIEDDCDLVWNLCEKYELLVENRRISQHEAQELIGEIIAGPKTDEPNKFGKYKRDFKKGVQIRERGCIGIEDTNGILIVDPSEEGRNISTADIFLRESKILEEKGWKDKTGDFLEYKWQLPDETKPYDRIEYFKYYKNWNWIIWADAYLDDFLAPMKSLRNWIITIIVAVTIGWAPLAYLITSKLTSTVEGLERSKAELSATVSLSGDVLDKVSQKGDLNARVDVSKLSGKHKTIGVDINLMIDSLQFKIEEIRKREEEVREARAYAEAIIANIADPLWVTDKHASWVLVNQAMKKVTGYSEKEVLEKQMLTHPLFSPFISMLDGKEKLKEMIEKVKAGEHIPGIFIPWLTKDNNLLMMSCSGEPLRDAAGNVIGGVFIGRDISVLQKTGIATTKTLNKNVEAKVGKDYELATQMFMSNATLIVGDSSLEILRGTVEGYNRRFNKNIGIKEGIALTNIPKEEWPSFLEFLLSTFFECIGPTTFECSEGIETIEDIVEKVKAKYEGKTI